MNRRYHEPEGGRGEPPNPYKSSLEQELETYRQNLRDAQGDVAENVARADALERALHGCLARAKAGLYPGDTEDRLQALREIRDRATEALDATPEERPCPTCRDKGVVTIGGNRLPDDRPESGAITVRLCPDCGGDGQAWSNEEAATTRESEEGGDGRG